ncbi:hypothetical protein ACPCUV_29730 [Streptomyces platensis]|uniref:hypothetical protein n=1 Tax=Streptomyces platensis TaxID=58346 RepID=UPI003C3030CA
MAGGTGIFLRTAGTQKVLRAATLNPDATWTQTQQVGAGVGVTLLRECAAVVHEGKLFVMYGRT